MVGLQDKLIKEKQLQDVIHPYIWWGYKLMIHVLQGRIDVIYPYMLWSYKIERQQKEDLTKMREAMQKTKDFEMTN